MFGVKVWTGIDPITSLEGDVLSEAKKKLAVGTIKISSVHPKSKKSPQIRVFVQTDSELKYVGTIGATKGPTKGVAEKFLKDNGVKMSDLPSGPKWTHIIKPEEGKKAGAPTGKEEPAAAQPTPKPTPEPEKKPPEPKLKKDLPEPKKTVTTKQQAAYNNIYQDAMHKADSDLSPEEKKIIDDLKYGLGGIPADADAEAVYKAWLDLHTGMTADDMEKDYGKDWSEKAWALSAALSKYKGGPGDKEWEQAKVAELAQKAKEVAAKVTGTPPPADTGKSLEGFAGALEMIDAAGGQSSVPDDVAEMLTKKYGDDWPQTYKMAQVIKAAGGADKLAQMAATHASMAKSMVLSYGTGWQEKAKGLHKELFGGEAGSLPPPADFNAPPPPPPAPPVSPTPVPTPVSSTAAPSYVPPPGGAPAADLEIPSPSNLKLAGNAKGLGGAGEKFFYQDKQGNKYLFKLATKKGTDQADPKRAFVQSAFSGIAKEIKSIHPKIETVKLGGKVGAIYPFLPGGNPSSLSGQSPSDLSPSEAWDVAEEHVIDWLMSQHDSHPGNFLRTEEGRIIGVDKEQGFKYFPNDKLSIDYHPNAKYNEQEPFYNTFWRDWTKGKVGFDPQKLGDSIDKAMAITPDTFFKNLRPYAEARHPGNKLDQENFLREAYNRKNMLKRDFEKFFTELYEKKNGEKGNFTFAGGWIPESEKDKPHIEIKVTPAKTQTSAQMLSELGGKTVEYKTKDGHTDPSKLTVKTHASKAELEAMLDKLGIKPHEVIEGSNYRIAFVDKKKWDAASLHTPEKKEEITVYPSKTIAPYSGSPKYMPNVRPLVGVEPNSAELKTITKRKDLGKDGARITFDGGAVEQQLASVKRRHDAKGDYYEVVFKLLPESAKTLRTKGNGDEMGFPVGDKYDEKEDKILDGVKDQSQTFGEYRGFPSRKFKHANGEFSMVNNQHDWVMDGMVKAHVRLKPGQNVHDALKEMLNSASPGLGNEVIRDPTPEERERVKLLKLLWAYAPQRHDALGSKQKYTVTIQELRDMLKEPQKKGYNGTNTGGGGLTDEEIDSAREVETMDNQTTWALPGRWRRDGAKGGKPTMRFLNWNASNVKKIASILKGGALGGPGRVINGLGYFGTDSGSEFHNGLDGMTWRLATELKEGNSIETSYGDYNIVVPPDEIDRLDVGPLYSGDTWGCLNPSANNGASFKSRLPLTMSLNNPSYNTGSSEVVVRKGIRPQRILRIAATTEDRRQTLLKELASQGITEVNGIPAEDFVVVSSTVSDIYNKYVKPAGF